MKIAIVYPSFGVVAVTNQPNIKAVASNYGLYPNISLAYVAGALQKAGHDILFLDAAASGYSLRDMDLKIKEFKPRILMFTVSTYLIHETNSIINYFKARHDCLIIVGGGNLSLYPQETLKNKNIDFGIIGEAEETTPELIDALEKKKDFSNIKGICYRKADNIIVNEKREQIKNLDSIPFPARNLLPNSKYYSFISKYKNYTIMMTSRGCTFQCNFCEQRTGDIRYRSPKNVADEMEECVKKYKIKEFDIFDPLFTINKKRVIQICQEIRRRKLKVFWSCRSRVDTVDDELLKHMKSAGCYRIYFGIESGDENILRNIKKFTTLKKIRESIALAKKNNILAFGYFMLGCPGEDEKTIKNTINLAKSLPLDYAQFSRFSILPGTEIYDNLASETKIDYWKRYTIDKSTEAPLQRIKCKLNDEALNAQIKKAYMSFYFRPKIILKFLAGIKSAAELKRYIKAGLEMALNN